MQRMIRGAAGAAGVAMTMVAAGPAEAGQGQIDGFGASASTVLAGTEVQFWASYSLTAVADQWGGSNTVEPLPQEGTQYWDINWYHTETETLTSVTLEVGGQGQTDILGLPPGASAAGSMAFAMVFTQPGSYPVTASGSWSSWVESYTSSESAYRNCWYNDPGMPDNLTCDSWTYTYYDYTDSYSGGGAFNAQQLTITVTAVPEPSALALWCAGLAAWVAPAVWRGRRRGARR